MGIFLYVEQENGNLKAVAEVDDTDSPMLAVDELLDETNIKDREFVAVVGSLDGGTVCRVTVEDDEPVQPKRKMSVTGGDSQPKRGRRSKAAEEEEEGEEEAPAPAKRRAPAKRKSNGRKAPAKRAPAKKAPAKKAAGGKKGSPFRKNPRSAE